MKKREDMLLDALMGVVGWIEGGCEEDGAAYVLHEAKDAITACVPLPVGTRVRLKSNSMRYEGGPGTIIKADDMAGTRYRYRVRRDEQPKGAGLREVWTARGEFDVLSTPNN